MPAKLRRILHQADFRQPRYPKPHYQRGHDGHWYKVDISPRGLTYKTRFPPRSK